MNTSKILIARLTTLALLFATIAAFCSPAAAGNLHALVIGNSAYEKGKLRNPANDAVALSKTLKTLGFEVMQLTDVGQTATEDAIFKFSRSIGDDGLAFFFFAGHGVQVRGENYLIPIDAKIREEYEVRHQCVSLGLILDALQNSRSNMNVVVLDCCRDNPFQRSWSRSYRSGLAATSVIPEGTLIAYATAPGETAADGEGVNSPYTLELCTALSKRPKKGLLLRDAFFEASRNVKRKTGQSPWINMEASLAKFYLTNPQTQPTSDSPDLDAIVATSIKPGSISIPPLPSKALPAPRPAAPTATMSSLEQQASVYLRHGDFTNAIEAFSAVIGDPHLPAVARNRARKARGSAYLSRGGKTDFDRAIIDHKAAGLPGIRVPVRVSSSALKVGTETRGSVKRNQILLVTLSSGDWLWVKSVNDDESLSGYVKKDALIEPKAVASRVEVAKPSSTSVSSTASSGSSQHNGTVIRPSQTSVYPQGTTTQTYPQASQQGSYPSGSVTYPSGSYPQGTIIYNSQGQRVYTQGQQTYSQPQQTYTQPRQTYTQPSQNYSQPSTNRGYTQQRSSTQGPLMKSFIDSFNQSYNRTNSILRGPPRPPTPSFMRRR